MSIHWLASYPKSGNTWVRALLEAYAAGDVDINNMQEVTGDSNACYYQLVSPVPYDGLAMYNFMAVRLAALNALIYLEAHRNRIICKTHSANANIIDIPTIPKSFSANSVYIVRDPRDVLPSWAAHKGQSVDEALEGMMRTSASLGGDSELGSVPTLLSSWDKHVESWEKFNESEHSCLIVRYEDLKAEPVKYLKKILVQYGYKYSQKKAEAAVRKTKLDRLKSQEDKAGFKEASKNSKFFGRKHKKLLVRQRKAVEKAFGPTMEKYGYL